MGGFLSHVSRLNSLEDIDKEQIHGMVDFSNAVGALCASKKGAIPGMPSMEDVIHCMHNTLKYKGL
jgi:fructokinase